VGCAVGALAIGVVVWLLSVWPGSPGARWGLPVVGGGLFLILPAWFATVRDVHAAYSEASLQTWRFPLPLRGWRMPVGVALALFALASFCLKLVAADPASTSEKDGRYFSDDHGVLTEISETTWRHVRADQSRVLASYVIAFAGLAAMYLTQTDIARGRSTSTPLHSGSPTGV
jgi:hypothetical protein